LHSTALRRQSARRQGVRLTPVARRRADVARLAVLEASHSGFAIAEADLAARGAGDVIGRRQSGRDAAGALRVARLPDDRDLLEAARRGAARALGRYGADPAAWPPALLAALRSQARPPGAWRHATRTCTRMRARAFRTGCVARRKAARRRAALRSSPACA
jgi:hypothetical protein